MSEYIPGAGEVRVVWSNQWDHFHGYQWSDEKAAEFDRFIVNVRADAWDMGYAAGQTDYESTRTNPHREEQP